MWPTFLNWSMAGWLAAASAPLIIHLLSKRRYRTRQWAAMRYLLEAVKKSQRRIHIEQLLLLLIRTLLILLVLLAIMEPVTRLASARMTPGDVRTHHLIVLDGSFSMGLEVNGQTLFGRAQQVAREIVANSGKGDGFTLLMMGSPPVEVIRTPALDSDQVTAEIDRLRLPHGSADVGATLEHAEQLLRRAAQERPQLKRQAVYFITDLGRATWTNQPPNEAALRNLQRRSQDALVHVIDLGLAGADNTAVTQLTSRRHYAALDQSVTFEAQLKNFGTTPLENRRVELLVDGDSVATQRVSLPPGVDQSVRFEHRFQRPGERVISVRLQADDLPIDNERWLVLPVRSAIGVLLVDGKPSGDPRRGATGYLRTALAPSHLGEDASVFRPDVRRESALLEIEDLSEYDAVVLSNVQTVSAAEAERLESYLHAGGGLILFLGDLVRPESYNHLLGGGDPQASDLLPATIGRLVEHSAEAVPRVDPLDNAHPMLRVFRGQERATLATAPVRSFHQLTLPEDTTSRIVAALTSGEPLIVEREVHRGQVVLVATGADRDQSGLPILPAWVPLIHEMVGSVIHRSAKDRTLQVGHSLGGMVPISAAGSLAEIRRPDETSETLSLSESPRGAVYDYGRTNIAGVYRVEFEAPEAEPTVFAVNVDPLESDLTKLTIDEFRDEILPGVELDYRNDAPDREPVTSGPAASQQHWAMWLLYAALGLLIVETWLACKFGHHGGV